MDDRNNQPASSSRPRTRQDSVSSAQRRGMQQGYPIRQDANRTIDQHINHADGTREIPDVLRQGKIPVRRNANEGRTYPVLNRTEEYSRPAQPFTGAEPTSSRTEPQQPAPLSRKKAWLQQLEEESRRLAMEEAEESVSAQSADTDSPAEADPQSARSTEDLQPDTPENPPEPPKKQAAVPELTPVRDKKAWLDQLEEDDKRFELLEERRARFLKAWEERTRRAALASEEPEENPAEQPASVPEAEAVPIPVQPEAEPAAAEKPVSAEAAQTETEVQAEGDTAAGSPDEDMSVPIPAMIPETDETAPNPAEETAEAAAEDTASPADSPSSAEEPAVPVLPICAPEELSADEADAPILTAEDTPAVPEQEAAADTPEETAEEGAEEDTSDPETEVPAVPAAKSDKKPWLIPLIAAILIAAGCGIGIPMAMAEPAETAPDYTMTKDYTESSPEGSESTPPETDPVPETAPEEVPFTVTLTFYKREPISVSTPAITLAELLEQLHYTVRDTDRFPIDLSAELTEDTVIAVDTVTHATMQQTVALPYETHVKELQTIPRGQKDLLQAGKKGEKTVTYSIEMINGKEVSRTVTDETVTRQPVNEIYQLGVGGTVTGADGKSYSYSYYRVVHSVGYDIEGPTYLNYDADETVAAVNLQYIPLNTKMYVKNDRYDFGVRTAADTASMIEGWDVYVWLSDSNPQKKDFISQGGCDDMIIYFLD